jgi:hypothetical protein
MANKLIITESQFNKIKQFLTETPLNRFISSSAKEDDLIQISVGDKKSVFKVVEVYKGFEITMVGLSDDVNDNVYVMRNNSITGGKIKLYTIGKDIDPIPDIKYWNVINAKLDKLELFRNGKIIDSADIRQTAIVDPNSTLGDYTDEEPEINPNLIHVGQDEKSPEINLGGSGNIPTGDAVIDDTEKEKPLDDREDDVDVVKKYYKEIMADPFLKQVFYKYPSTWDYIVAAAKGEKAKGGGLGPALELIDSYKNGRASELTPGFTNKEKKVANFKIKESVNIKYQTISGKAGRIVLNYWDTHGAIVQKYPTVGNGAITTLKNSDKNYKIDILDSTEDPNVFICDFSAYKKGVIEEDTYYSERIEVEFTQSPGYNYVNKDTTTTNTNTNK